MKILGKYRNGNYNVVIFDDGTKVRFNKEDKLIPDMPESMDIKITNMCDMGCPFCHENSTVDGKHGDIMNLKFIDTLLPYTELAIGGGNPLCHPDLIEFLKLLKSKNLIANMTVNQKHFLKNVDMLKQLCSEGLLKGLGVSLTKVTDKLIDALKEFPNAVIHVINGVHSIEEIEKLYDHDFKMLILGYKFFRRGEDYYSEKVDKLMDEWYFWLPEMLNRFEVVSFDNLALKQLKCERLMSEEEWSKFYMGDDGNYTLYVDVVNQQFAKSSVSTERYSLLDDMKDMFSIIKQSSCKEV